MKTAYDITWKRNGKTGDPDAQGYWNSKDGRFSIAPSFRHTVNPSGYRLWDKQDPDEKLRPHGQSFNTVRDAKEFALQVRWREWKQTHHTVQVTVGQALHRPVAKLLKTLGTLYPGSFTDGSTTWTFPLTTELTPEQVQEKVWEKFVGVYCRVA